EDGPERAGGRKASCPRTRDSAAPDTATRAQGQTPVRWQTVCPGLTPGHQSAPRGLSSSGTQAFSQVVTETWLETMRTLPSPRPTGMAPVCGEEVTPGLQNPAAGVIWNGRLPDVKSMLVATTPLKFSGVPAADRRARYAPVPNTAMFQ